ncbi:uncharacterized protein LOC128244019 [Mya arenaria]|uniref:uncharacterized protein LOC128244019 n=1 Tax=Mya arenaria TaxID=6604 RepID=UPI0022E3FACE|nr:uncharacterized protein LOC128244019 [Mya arenaria]
MVLNNQTPTRNDKVIDLSIVTGSLSQNISNWKVQEEAYLNTDHKLITFQLGEKETWKAEERWDFKNANWLTWEKETSERLQSWIEQQTNSSVDVMYASLVETLLSCAENVIPKKKICPHSKGYWSPELNELNKKFKQAKRKFQVRSDPANERAVSISRQAFQETIEKAKTAYLDLLTHELDPRKPEKFWKIINKHRSDESKCAVQPIVKEDLSLAVSDVEIFQEMKQKYGKETLEVKEKCHTHYYQIENQVETIENDERMSLVRDPHTMENSDITLDEVESVLKEFDKNSAPCPEERIFGSLEGWSTPKGIQQQHSWKTLDILEGVHNRQKILPKGCMATVNSYRGGGNLARTIYNRMLEDQKHKTDNHHYWYSVDHSRLPEWMCDHFVQLSEDSETRDFLENCYEKSDWVVTQIYHSLAKAFLSWFMETTSINGLLGRGSMFVFSRSHFQQLLGVSADWRASNLLDLGAGDGKVTEKMASFFSKVYVTETSPTMVSRLQEKQYRVLGIDQWDNGSLQYDVISCLNLLDRCDRPMSILRSMRRVLAPGGRVIVAVVIPFSPFVEFGSSNNKPTERLNIDGATFEAQCESMVRDVFRPAGFSLLHFSRVPYLCEGDLHSSFYVLNDTVFVLTADDHG